MLQVFDACCQELPWEPLYSRQQFPMGERFSSCQASQLSLQPPIHLDHWLGVTDTKVDCLPQRSKGSKAQEPEAVTCSKNLREKKGIGAMAPPSQDCVSRRATEGGMVCPAGML